jgi:transcriptional activator of cad operon
VALVALSSMESRPPVNKARLLLNPRDIDIHLVNGNSCANWSSQHSYAVGLASLITTSLNTFSTFMVHDKTDYNINEPSSSGKTLTIEFIIGRSSALCRSSWWTTPTARRCWISATL